MSNDNHNHSYHAGSSHDFITKIAFLDHDTRKRTLPPDEILNMLPILKGMDILDVGAGSGYLSIPAAKKTDGIVYALDMDARMLEVIDAKTKAEKLSNIALIQGNINNIPLPDSSVDIVLASLILHEVRALPAVLTQLRRVLKTGGYFLCLEYEKEESAVKGPPMHIRIPSVEMEQQLITAGFSNVQKVFSRESIYIIVAQKTGGVHNEY